MKAFVGQATAPRASVRPTRAVRACAHRETESKSLCGVALAGLAAAVLSVTPAANAGVILEQPKLKQVLITEDAPKPEPKPKAAPEPKAPKPEPVESGPLDLRLVTLPGSVLAIVGGGLALTRLDPGFSAILDTGSCKNSNIDGAGYEVAIKGGTITNRPSKSGTILKRFKK